MTVPQHIKALALLVALPLLASCEPASVTIPLPNLSQEIANTSQAITELPEVSASAPVIADTPIENASFRDPCGDEFVFSVSRMAFLENGRTLLEFSLFNTEVGSVEILQRGGALYVTDEFGNRYDFVRSPYDLFTSGGTFTVAAGTRETIWAELPPIDENATTLTIRSRTPCTAYGRVGLPQSMPIELNATFEQFRSNVIRNAQATDQN